MSEHFSFEPYETEQIPARIPSYDSFGDPDEALAWVADRAGSAFGSERMVVWWTQSSTALGGLSPATLWVSDPDRVIRLLNDTLTE